MSVLSETSLRPRSARRGPARHAPLSPLADAVQRARRWLLAAQNPDGHWRPEIQGDTILESEYILLMAFLGRETEEKVRKAAAYIVTQQRPEGAWSNYPGGPVDISVSVKAYFALKLAGHSADRPYMRRARDLILQGGGAVQCNSFTKFYLAFLGQFPYDNVPSVPAEMIFLPRSAYINLYAMSSWTRTIVVPLSIFSAYKPVRRIPAEKGIAELFLEPQFKRLPPCPPTRRLLTAPNLFLGIDYLIKFFEKWGPQWVRRLAVKKATRWMLDHFEDSDGVGAIFPPIIYTIICLRCLGYADDSEEMRWALKQLDDLMIEEDDTLRIQPCFSPVWDTALALNTLAAGGTRGCEIQVAQAARWLLDREVRRKGDWSLMNPGVEPGGWFFEYRNGFYPDTDDTAMVLMALARTGLAWERSQSAEVRVQKSEVRVQKSGVRSRRSEVRGQESAQPRLAEDGPLPPCGGGLGWGVTAATEPQPLPAVTRAINWLLAMQNDDGGWAAFDRNINRELLTKVPFADHNAMLDPSCPDITARALEALGQFGFCPGHPQVDRALAFIAKTQDPRGCWIGRWGVNYIYGTWQVLVGLEAIGFDMREPMIRKAVAWLEGVQQPSGAWGESCATYDDPATAGQGAPTASQTGWALLALMAAGEIDSDAVRRGIDYLLRTQDTDGAWQEDEFTGTGFPKVFYLKYHNYRLYFPLMALSRYAAWEREKPVGYVWDESGQAPGLGLGSGSRSGA